MLIFLLVSSYGRLNQSPPPPASALYSTGSTHIFTAARFALAKNRKPSRCLSAALVVESHLPARETRETQGQSLGGEDPLEEGMAAPSSLVAWRIPWTEEPGGLQSVPGVAESDTTEAT